VVVDHTLSDRKVLLDQVSVLLLSEPKPSNDFPNQEKINTELFINGRVELYIQKMGRQTLWQI